MIVTKVIPQPKKRYKVELDGEYAFTLYQGELKTYQIEENKELPASVYQEIMTQVLPKRAKLRGMNLLMSRFYTIRQLSDKLRDGGYPEPIVEDTIAYLKSYHYLDDVRYAEDFLRSGMNTYSQKELTGKLMKKGISGETLEIAMNNLMDTDDYQDENEAILRLLNKKNYHPDKFGYEEEQKLLAFFYRKGFPLDKVRKVMETFKA